MSRVVPVRPCADGDGDEPAGAEPPVAVGKEPISPGNGAYPDADDKYSWQLTMKALDKDIKDCETAPLTFADVVAYELEVIKYSVLPLLCVCGVLLALLMPYYSYAKDDAIPKLKAEGFVADTKKTTELGLCPVNAVPDTCVDPRFVMMYGVQEQFGQLYDSFLPQMPTYLFNTMFIIPLVFWFGVYVHMVCCAGPLATVDGKQSADCDIRATHRLVLVPWLIGATLHTTVQVFKAIGMIGSKLGSIMSILAAIVAFYGSFRRIVHTGNGDASMMKGFIAQLFAGLCSIAINQLFMKRLTKEIHFCILWFVWVILAEIGLGYFRLCVRKLDLRKCDMHTCYMLAVNSMACFNLGKRIALLLLAHPVSIAVMNAVCFLVEVANRITVVPRDELFDRVVRRQTKEEATAWKDSLHRQVYIHNEMLQEILELIYPIPVAVVLYLTQFNPVGVPTDFATIATNCALQIVLELIADMSAIYYGSAYQAKFYRVACKNMWNPYRFKLLCVLITYATFAVSGFFFYTYLRIGETAEGDYITLI